MAWVISSGYPVWKTETGVQYRASYDMVQSGADVVRELFSLAERQLVGSRRAPAKGAIDISERVFTREIVGVLRWQVTADSELFKGRRQSDRLAFSTLRVINR